MADEIVKVNGEIVTHLGPRDAVAQVQARIMKMMPGASNAPADVVWAAAQIAVAHRLDPFNGEIYIINLGKRGVDRPDGGTDWVDDYRPYIGVKGLRRKARERSNYMTSFRVLEAAEVKALRGNDYDAEDVGVECTLARLDAALQARYAGLEYSPHVTIGLWRKKATFHKKKNQWIADNVPNTWTREQVARKRAEINALKEAFDLSIDVADPAVVGEFDTARAMAEQIAVLDREMEIIAPRKLNRNEDGQVLLAGKGKPPAAQRSVPDDPDEWEDEYSASAESLPSAQSDPPPDEDNPFDDLPFGPPAPPPPAYEPVNAAYRDVIAKAEGNTLMLIEWARKRHRAEGGPATKPQYGYLAGRIDEIIGVDKSHRAVLEVLTGSPVNADNPPSYALAQSLLDYLLVTRRERDAPKDAPKTPNPQYREDIVGHVKRIWELCLELEGQLRMPGI